MDSEAVNLLRELAAYWDDEDRSLRGFTRHSDIEEVKRVGNRLGLKNRELKMKVRLYLERM